MSTDFASAVVLQDVAAASASARAAAAEQNVELSPPLTCSDTTVVVVFDADRDDAAGAPQSADAVFLSN